MNDFVETDEIHIRKLAKNDSFMPGKRNGLVPGGVTENHFWLLIEISSIHSDKVITSLYEHLVLGYTRKEVCERNKVSAGYLSISLAKLFRVDFIVISLLDYYI